MFTRGTVIFPYVYASVWSAVPLGGLGSYSLEAYGTSCTLQWDQNRAYITLMSLCCIATPAMLIFCTYGLILLKCRRSSRKLRIWKSSTNKMSKKESYLIKVGENFRAIFPTVLYQLGSENSSENTFYVERNYQLFIMKPVLFWNGGNIISL